MTFLSQLVLDKVRSFGTLAEAADFFNVRIVDLDVWAECPSSVPVDAVEKVFDVTKLLPAELRPDGTEIAVMLPWYKSTNPVTAFSVMNVVDRSKMSVMLRYGDAFIVHTRNKLAQGFLEGKCEWAFTVDDDMVLPFGKARAFNDMTGLNLPEEFAGRHTIKRLMSHGKTLVGGLYFGRWKHGKPVYAEAFSDENEAKWVRSKPRDLLKPTRWVGTGCMLIHRSVFQDIQQKFPHLKNQWFTSSEHDLRSAMNESMAILMDSRASAEARVARSTEIMDCAIAKANRNSGLGMGEDVIFCHRAAQAGHQPFVDLGLICGHIGSSTF